MQHVVLATVHDVHVIGSEALSFFQKSTLALVLVIKLSDGVDIIPL